MMKLSVSCERRHAHLKSKCPAWGKTCSKCSKRNHFAVKCRHSDDRNVHAVNEVDSDIESINTVHAVDNGGHQIYGEVNIKDFPVRIQIDSGATVNVIPKRYIGDNHVMPTSTVLQMWNKTRLIPVGEAKVELHNPANNRRYKVKFIVVDDESGLVPLLGKGTKRDAMRIERLRIRICSGKLRRIRRKKTYQRSHFTLTISDLYFFVGQL